MEEKEYYEKLGKYFRDLREAKGIKQIDLASQMGIHSAIISEFENKGTKISAFRLDQIHKVLTGEGLFEKKTPKLRLTLPESHREPLSA